MGRTASPHRSLRAPAGLVALLALLLVGTVPIAATGGPVPSGTAHAAAASGTPVTGTISGPTQMAPIQRSVFYINGSGGPAQAANGTFVGTISYSASIVGANTSGGTVAPPQGILINGTGNFSLIAPNATGPITLYVDLTSTLNGKNASTNLSWGIDILTPIVLAGGLKVLGPTSIKPFQLAVELDGAVVGSVKIPALTSGQDYPFTFSFLGQSLAPGWHTFSVSLAQEHGLVVFANGAESYSVAFYIPGGGPDYSLWIVSGVIALAAVGVIWTTRVAARRRPKGKA